MQMIKITILALFTSLLLVRVLNWGYYVKKALKKNTFDQLKPFDCLPCSSFWVAIILSIIFANSIEVTILASALSYILATQLDK
jgi:hypothetical protein